MSIRDQSDKDLADTGRMLAAEIGEIAAELERRGIPVAVQGYYRFEAKRITEESI